VFDDILCTYILIYSTHNGDDAPQNRSTDVVEQMPRIMQGPKIEGKKNKA